MSYALQARITVDDKLCSSPTTRHQVDPLTDEPQTVLVKMVAQQDEPTAATIFGTDWVVEYVDGIEVIAERRSHVPDRARPARSAASGPCNGYFASAKIDGSALAIGQAGSTQMACAPEVMAAEAGAVRRLGQGGVLSCSMRTASSIADKDGRDILRFSAVADTLAYANTKKPGLDAPAFLF